MHLNRSDGRRTAGFSLLELMIVVGIAVTIAGIAIPSMTTAMANAKLRASMTSLSGLNQNCRMAAVKENRTMTARYLVQSSGLVAYIKNAADSSPLNTSDYQVEMESPIQKMAAPTGLGAPPAITTTALGFTPQTGDSSFNSRGLPCAYSAGTCTSSGFIAYFKDLRIADSGGWASISISPAGRIKRWFWSGSGWTD